MSSKASLLVSVLLLSPPVCWDYALTAASAAVEETDLQVFGEPEPGLEYDFGNALFDFDVLVTGYEPFLDHLVNPAQSVAGSLNGTCDTVYLTHPRTMRLCYEGVSVPVTAEGSGWAARQLEETPTRWDGIIHLGFESSAKGLRLETIAANVKTSDDYHYLWNSDIPCQKEGTPFEYIREGSPCILPTTAPVSFLDLHDLAELLQDGGHADLVTLETWSRDAGAYYCNEMFYRTLHAIRELGTPSVDGSSLIPAMFVHLPAVAVMGLDDMAFMVRFVAQRIMLGTVGLLPDACSHR
ncbi:unnamed protein product [Ectocarpus sp. 8 AP-2014]